MTPARESAPVVSGAGLARAFGGRGASVQALDSIDFQARWGEITALAGSDGSGKTTLIRLIAGLLAPEAGTLRVLGVDVARDPQAAQARIGYMPQRFGLYEDLTVQENLDLYADLHAVAPQARARKYPELMAMTALEPFRGRLAGKLSGGMKQKLGLACTLVSTPELLLLDEPTAGVDPLSRRELWSIVRGLVRDQGLPVIVATSYLDEADHCDQAVVLHKGKVLARGAPGEISAAAAGRVFRVAAREGETPRELQARLLGRPEVIDAVPEAGRVRTVLKEAASAAAVFEGRESQGVEAGFEDGFMVLLRTHAGAPAYASSVAEAHPGPDRPAAGPGTGSGARRRGGSDEAQPAVHVRGLVRRFGAFVAVDDVSFDVPRGEIFGLLGPNGAGKTTTFRMLCGLLPVSGGELIVGGADMRRSRAEARNRLGYVAQKFSLYGNLTVAENLDFFASVYGLRNARKRERIAWALAEFALEAQAHLPAGELAGGYRQRLAMAAALLHQPEILFLDEPTSGADPLARRDFWRRITELADEGVTVIITTHFMAEAEYCDRIAILDSGRILAQGPPAEIRARGRAEPGREPDMEDAFIAVVEEARAAGRAGGAAA
jgi:ABC-2 type transport system ATP-binding protein